MNDYCLNQSQGLKAKQHTSTYNKSRGGGVMPYMGYIGMYRCEGYDFQAG